MAFDQEHLARIALDRPVEAIGDTLQLRRLVGRNFPRPEFEVDAVEIDARHQLPYRRAVADFVERITPLDPVYRGRFHGVVDQIRRRILRLHDVAIIGNADHRRRQIDIEAADSVGIAIAVVDDDDLAAALVPANPAQQLAVAADHRDDLAAVGTNHDGAGLAADLLGADIARTVTESLILVVANERLAAGIDNDHTAGLGEDLAAALIAFLPRSAEVFHASRPRRGCAGCDRCQGLSRRRRGWNGLGVGWRRAPHKRRGASG